MSGWLHVRMRSPEFRNAAVSGYEKAEVDAFVVRVLRTLQSPRAEHAVTPAEIVDMNFSQAWASGYRKDDVDQWLDQAEQALHYKGRP